MTQSYAPIVNDEPAVTAPHHRARWNLALTVIMAHPFPAIPLGCAVIGPRTSWWDDSIVAGKLPLSIPVVAGPAQSSLIADLPVMKRVARSVLTESCP